MFSSLFSKDWRLLLFGICLVSLEYVVFFYWGKSYCGRVGYRYYYCEANQVCCDISEYEEYSCCGKPIYTKIQVEEKLDLGLYMQLKRRKKRRKANKAVLSFYIIAWVYLTAVAIFVVVVARTVCCYQKRKKLQHYREQAYYRMEEQLVKQTKKKKKAPQAEL